MTIFQVDLTQKQILNDIFPSSAETEIVSVTDFLNNKAEFFTLFFPHLRPGVPFFLSTKRSVPGEDRGASL